jgi:GH18 family chitinase
MGHFGVYQEGNRDLILHLEEPIDIIPSYLTHIIYAFADVNPSSGSIFLTDSYADEQVGFLSDVIYYV